MQPQLEIIDGLQEQAFVWKKDDTLWPVWHFHPEIDILLNLKHTGTFLAGDHIGELEPGTLFINAPNIPHAFHGTEPIDFMPGEPAMMVLFFSFKSLGRDLLGRPELRVVRDWLQSHTSSIQLTGQLRDDVEADMRAMEHMTDTERFIGGLKILDRIARSSETVQLSSPAYTPTLKGQGVKQLNLVIQYIHEHQRRRITLAEVSGLVNMSEKSFCRFFRRNTGRTFVRYVNEMRIGEACKQLINSSTAITDIGFEVGFSNTANFNRRFLESKGMTPRAYRQTYLQHAG